MDFTCISFSGNLAGLQAGEGAIVTNNYYVPGRKARLLEYSQTVSMEETKSLSVTPICTYPTKKSTGAHNAIDIMAGCLNGL